jgi:hypothetical protein
VNPLWSKADVAAEREYRFTERLGLLCGADAVPLHHFAVELAGAEVRAWEREMAFAPATPDQKSGQMTML